MPPLMLVPAPRAGSLQILVKTGKVIATPELRPKRESALTTGFLCHLLNSPQMHDIVSGYANGTTVNMLPLDGVQKPVFSVPPAGLVKVFGELASASEARRETLVTESRTLATMRDALLPKLVSGELRIKDAERIARAGA